MLRFWLLAPACILIYVVCNTTPVLAVWDSISHSYQTTTALPSGSLVSVDPKRNKYVLPANSQNGQQLTGIVTVANNSLLAVNESTDTTQVAVSGTAAALVSDVNGTISRGDDVAVSPINGIGMKAAAGARIIGVAQADFNSKSAGASSQQIKGANNRTRTVATGLIPVSIAIGDEPATAVSGSLVGARQFVSSALGHPVSILAVVLSAVVTLIALTAVIALTYGTIHGSIISIGRNPLAKVAVFESLAQVMAMEAVILALAVVIVFLILR